MRRVGTAPLCLPCLLPRRWAAPRAWSLHSWPPPPIPLPLGGLRGQKAASHLGLPNVVLKPPLARLCMRPPHLTPTAHGMPPLPLPCLCPVVFGLVVASAHLGPPSCSASCGTDDSCPVTTHGYAWPSHLRSGKAAPPIRCPCGLDSALAPSLPEHNRPQTPLTSPPPPEHNRPQTPLTPPPPPNHNQTQTPLTSPPPPPNTTEHNRPQTPLTPSQTPHPTPPTELMCSPVTRFQVVLSAHAWKGGGGRRGAGAGQGAADTTAPARAILPSRALLVGPVCKSQARPGGQTHGRLCRGRRGR